MQVHQLTLSNKIARLVWRSTWMLFAAWTPVFMHRWRVLLLRFFGGQASYSSYIYPSVKIWDPKNIILGHKSTLGPDVDCYNVSMVDIGDFVTVSQKTYLCTASHDYDQAIVTNNLMDLIVGPIIIKDFAWIAAEVFVGPDRTIGYGSVVLARSVVTKNTLERGVYGGNPMRHIRDRKSVLHREVE